MSDYMPGTFDGVAVSGWARRGMTWVRWQDQNPPLRPQTVPLGLTLLDVDDEHHRPDPPIKIRQWRTYRRTIDQPLRATIRWEAKCRDHPMWFRISRPTDQRHATPIKGGPSWNRLVIDLAAHIRQHLTEHHGWKP